MTHTATHSGVLVSPDGRPILSYALHLDGRLFEVCWQPGITLVDGEQGVRFMFEQMVQHGSEALLSDSIRNSLDWSELVPILRYEEYPRAVAAGLRWRASVIAANPMDALAHYELQEEIDGLLVNGFFHTVEQARAWLLEKLGQ